MATTMRYKDFVIQASEIEPGRWQAEIRKADRRKIKTATGEVDVIPTPVRLTADEAIQMAKQLIDAGDMR